MVHLHCEEGSYAFIYLLGNTDRLHFENLNTISEFIIDLKH